MSINFVPFGEKALLITASLYDEYANYEAVIDNLILKSIIQVIVTLIINLCHFTYYMGIHKFFIMIAKIKMKIDNSVSSKMIKRLLNSI